MELTTKDLGERGRRRCCWDSARLKSGGTGDDVDEVVGDGGLSTAVVDHVEVGDHVAGVLGGVVHGVALGVDLGGVSLDEGGVDGVGKGELGEVLGDVVLLLVELELGGVAERVFGEDLDDVGLEGEGRDVLVVDEVDLVELDAGLDDLVCDGGCVGEGGDVLADLVEGERDVLGERAAELGLGLFAEDDDGGALGGVGVAGGGTDLVELGLGALCDGGVDTAAETLVGGDDDEELAATLGSDGLGVLEDLCGASRSGEGGDVELECRMEPRAGGGDYTYRCWRHRRPWQRPWRAGPC